MAAALRRVLAVPPLLLPIEWLMNGLASALAGVVMDALPSSVAVPGWDLAQCALPATATCSGHLTTLTAAPHPLRDLVRRHWWPRG